MTKKQIERNREFLKDLRKNRKKARAKLADDKGGRCCLGVACNTAKRLGLHVEEEDGNGVPPPGVAKFFGWDDVNPLLKIPIHEPHSAAVINDSNGNIIPIFSHKQIANLFEATFPQLKP